MPRTIAVTGASGFIGRRLIEQLCKRGHRVRALQRRRSIDGHDRLTCVNGSIEDPGALADLVGGVDAVLHLAGLIKARRKRDFFDVNANGVTALIRAMDNRATYAKLVLISSLAAREPGLSSYAASKRCGEAALLSLGAVRPWTVLRPPAVYGPGDVETLAFFKGIKRRLGVMLGGQAARFSLIHVDDLIDAIIQVIAPGVADGLVLELDDGREGGYSWSSMIAAGEAALDQRARRLTVPPLLLRSIGYANAALGLLPGYVPMLTPEKAAELLHDNWVADNGPIQRATSWQPSIPIDRGFGATVDWYQLHNWL